MTARIATVSGTMLAPGVSKNRRRYTRENIAAAARRLNDRLADPNGRPVTMRTHHPNGPSDMAVTAIAGRLTSVAMGEDGSLRWAAEIADTAAGRDVAALTTPDSPYLRNVSIRGWWVGDVRTDPDGCETADDLEIDGLDFTPNPGVDAARIHSAIVGETIPAGCRRVFESAPAAHFEDSTPTRPLHEMSLDELQQAGQETFSDWFPHLPPVPRKATTR